MNRRFAWLAIVGLGLAPAAVAAESPMDIVIARMDALNQHDFDAFLATYADDVWIGVYPDRELGTGHGHLEFIFAQQFADKALSVQVDSVLSADGYVVVESTTTFADAIEKGLALYEVRDGLIRRVSFLRDNRRATRTPLPIASEKPR